MKLNYEGLKEKEAWRAAGIRLPEFDWEKARKATLEEPVWIHFGAGNIFRGFPARLSQVLLEKGLVKAGIVAAETFDYEIIDRIYAPYDNLSLLATLLPDGSVKKEVVASIGAGLRAGSAYPEDMAVLRRVFENPALQMASLTITEKGYALKDLNGRFFPAVQKDLEQGPQNCSHAMSVLASLLLARYRAGGKPLALVSMDNCSHNGEKLQNSVKTVAQRWAELGFADGGFPAWLAENVSFPWTMIDKITPRPDRAVADSLAALGVEGMEPIVTAKNTYIAAFVNAEQPEYLVIEDDFPNGRPPLEAAGVYMADRETVNKVERMKVTTCLNPLHTALAIMGCLLGYKSIAAEMEDPELRALAEGIGCREGLPVVTDPGILNPEEFLREVLERRLPNPFIPDTPQRIATDTSQKIAIRFGETIKAYQAREDLSPQDLTCIPLAIAGWLRYLLAVDDRGEAMACSPDPMLETLRDRLSGITLGAPGSVEGKLSSLLSNASLFGCDLIAAGLGEKIEAMLKDMLEGPGAVRAALKKYLGGL